MEACEFLEWNCTDDIVGNKGNHESAAAAAMGDFSIFPVDDLLDFSNEEIAGYIGDGDTTDDGNHWPSCVSSPKTIITDSDSNHDSSNIANPQSNSEQQQQPHHLCVPEDDLGELEWLSNFVEDSFSEKESAATLIPPCFGSGSATPTTAEPVGCNSNSTSSWVTCETDYCPSSTTSAKSSAIFNLEAPVPGRARSKRSRISSWNISSRIIENKTSTHSHFYSSDLEFPPVKKKLAVLKPPVSPEQPLMAANVRKCSHCETTKTPQWRTGPKGPKTLCNACGVRYKSGRLVPEYRPAASPTFVPSEHSNSHRKVMEMRRQKERRQQQQFAINGRRVVASLQFHSSDIEEDDHCNNSNTNFSGFSSSAWLGFAASSSSEYDDENTYLFPTKHDYRHLIL